MILLTRSQADGKAPREALEFRTLQEAQAAAQGFEHQWLRCDGCQMVTVNGTACHEAGCPGDRTASEEAGDDQD